MTFSPRCPAPPVALSLSKGNAALNSHVALAILAGMRRAPWTISLTIVLLLMGGCAGSAPPAAEPEAGTASPETAVEAGPVAATTGGKKVWEAVPDAPHGKCCTSDDECGPITCEPYEYATESCTHVCTYSCEPGDLCPWLGGTLDPPPPCPGSGLCPVGPPWV